jgi:carbon monoxide dehydrogenase subunit G
VKVGYSFLTTWLLDAPRDEVWDAIYDIERWPEWWKGVEVVEKLGDGHADGIGSVYRHRWRSVLPYTVSFDIRTVQIERPFLIEGHATGELEGVGRWRLYEGDGTAVTYEWVVRTTRPWMNVLAPVGRPIFVWSHNTVMRWGGQGLARLLGARLLERS